MVDHDGYDVGKLKRVERKSKTLGKKPPKGAVVLFANKKDVAKWRRNKPNPRKPDDIQPAAVNKAGFLERGCFSKQEFQSGLLHLEFLTPYGPGRGGQGRGNSGCYVQGRYEVQVLDSFGVKSPGMGDCGSIYSVEITGTNMCYPPLQWQTYDIEYTACKFDADGKLIAPAVMTVWHNGVLVHKDQKVLRKDGKPPVRGTTAAPYGQSPKPGPVYLQHHGNYVVYRNVWFVPRK